MSMILNNNGIVYEFDNGSRFDLTSYPPFPVMWLYTIVDVAWKPFELFFGSRNWRSLLNLNENSWLSEKFILPPIVGPELLSWQEFWNQQHPGKTPIDAMFRFAFQTSSTALGCLDTPIALFVVFVLWMMIRQIKSILMPLFEGLARTAAVRSHGAAWIAENEIRITKFGEYMFRLLYHSTVSAYGLYFFYRNATWWQDTEQIMRGFPHHDIPPAMAWYYLFQCAYNVEAFVSLLELSFTVRFRSPTSTTNNSKVDTTVSQMRHLRSPVVICWSPNVRGDFNEMFIHHIATNLLVFGSSIFRFTRVGSMVFLVHDVSDIPVDLSKLANFMKWKATTVICFLTMAITWLYARLFILPFVIFKTIVMHSHYVLELGMVPVVQFIFYRPCFYLVVGLLIHLHATWFLMFIRIFATLVTKRECHDYSEHKQGEHNNSNGTATTNGHVKKLL